MDINEFVKQVKPRAKRSQLDPFKAQIFELRELGYANWQIRDWLATNGIEVTQESVRKFVVTRESANAQPANKEKSAVINLNCEEINHLVQLNDYLTVSSLVMNILKEKVVSTNPEWLNSRCCCLKVFNKSFVLSWPLCSRLHVWPNFFIIAFIRFLRGINESQNPSSQLLFFSIFHTIYTHQYLL